MTQIKYTPEITRISDYKMIDILKCIKQEELNSHRFDRFLAIGKAIDYLEVLLNKDKG
jgi:hypothetical protein